MEREGQRRERVGQAAFVAALLLRAWVVATCVRPPVHPRLDVNLYLESALHLWRDGTFGSQVALSYPPLTPLFFAPAFAIDDHQARLVVLGLMQVLVLALASLALLPLLTEALGRRRAWFALAGAQLLAGGTWHAIDARSESLFAALLLGVVGAVHAVATHPTPIRVAMLAAAVVLSISCRRIGVVVPIASGVPLLALAWPTLRREGLGRPGGRLLVAAGVGALIGAAPEAWARTLQIEAATGYHNAAIGHLRPLVSMWSGLDTITQAAAHLLRQPLYLVLAFGGAPLVLAATLVRQDPAHRPPPPAWAAGATALLLGLGLAAVSGLHILRYAFARGMDSAFHLYPRYLDPAEAPMVLTALAAAAWACRRDAPRLGRAVLPWAVAALVLIGTTGAVHRPRGYRIVWQGDLMPGLWVAEHYPWLWPLGVTAVVLAATLLFARRQMGRPAAVLLAVVAGWSMSFHLPDLLYTRVSAPPELSPLVDQGALAEAPNATLGVVLDRTPPVRRDLLAPAFRSNHDVHWVRPDQLEVWRGEHPDALLLTWSPAREHPVAPAPDVSAVQVTANWTVWRRREGGRRLRSAPSPPPTPRSPGPGPPD